MARMNGRDWAVLCWRKRGSGLLRWMRFANAESALWGLAIASVHSLRSDRVGR